MADTDTSALSGIEFRGHRLGALSTDSWTQYVVPTRNRITSYRGHAGTFITPGRATAPQRLLALHNSTSSTVLVDVNRIHLHLYRDTIKTIGVIPPTIRVCRFTALPTNGTALTKVPLETALSSNSAVTLWQDASADGTASASALTVTAGSPLEQQWAGRGAVSATTASAYEKQDSITLFDSPFGLTLQALQGVLVLLDNYSATTGNPLADRWVASIEWEEYTRP
jgi:hypothetical protein